MRSPLIAASLLCLTLWSAPSRAAEVVFSCNVVQDVSKLGFPEIIGLDPSAQTITHLKQTWSDGQPSRLADSEEQFVRITKSRLTWGSRRKSDGIITDLFSIDRASGAYAWLDSNGAEIAHGSCKLPDLTS